MQSSGAGEDSRGYLQQYFTGSVIQFGYGSGTSSNRPRVELTIHYCSNGAYYSRGQSCRPNIIAKGYQCTNIQDSGQWQVSTQASQTVLQWLSNANGPGSLMVYIRGDGKVVDAQGNPFDRIGQAQC